MPEWKSNWTCEITMASSDTTCSGTSLGSDLPDGEPTFLWFIEGSTKEWEERHFGRQGGGGSLSACRTKTPLLKSSHFIKRGILLSTPYPLNVLDKWASVAHFWLWLQWICHSVWQHYPGVMACNGRVLISSLEGGVHLSQTLMWNSNWDLKTSLRA